MKLVMKETQEPAVVGEVYPDFRGDSHTLEGGREPLHENSTGRVFTDKGEFFPSVIGMEWV